MDNKQNLKNNIKLFDESEESYSILKLPLRKTTIFKFQGIPDDNVQQISFLTKAFQT